MAYEESLVNVTRPASGDLSGNQFYALVINTDGDVELAGAGVAADGILQNKPSAQGNAASLGISGVSKAIFGATVAAGDLVATDSAGKIVTASGAATNVIGRCVIGGAVDEIGSILLDTKATLTA